MHRIQFIYSIYSDEYGMRLFKNINSIMVIDRINFYTPVKDDPMYTQKTKEQYEQRVKNPMSFSVITQRVKDGYYRRGLTYDFLSDLMLIAQNVVTFNGTKENYKTELLTHYYRIYPELQQQDTLEYRSQEQNAVISAFLCRCSDEEFAEMFDTDQNIEKWPFRQYLELYTKAALATLPTPERLDFSGCTVDMQQIQQNQGIYIQDEQKSEISHAETPARKRVDEMNVEELREFLKRLQYK